MLRLGVFLVPCLPLVVTPPLLFPYVTGRHFAFRILVELLLIPLVILAVVHRRRVLPRSGLALALLAFLACVTIADLLGVDPSRSFWSTYQRMEGLLGLLHLGLFFVVLRAALVTGDDWRRYITISIGVSALVALLALVQFALMAGAGLAVRPGGPLGNAGPLGGYLLLHVFLGLLVLAGPPPPRWRRGLAAIVAFLVGAIYISGTRSAVLGLLVAAPAAAWLWSGWRPGARRGRPRLSRRRAAVGAAGAAALVVLLALSPITGTLFRGFTESTPSVRALVWAAAWQGVRERPWLGWGQENFHAVWNPHDDLGEPFDRPHNVVLEWLFTGGMLAFAAGIVVMLALARRLSAVLAANRACGAALGGLFVAWGVYALGWFDTLETYLPLVSALAFADWQAHGPRPPDEAAPGMAVPAAWRRLLPVAAATLAVMGAVYTVNVRPLLLARDTVTAMRAWAEDRDVAAARTAFERVLDDPSLRTHEPAERMASPVSEIVALRGDTQRDEVTRYVDRVVRELRALAARPFPEVKHVRLLGAVAAAASPIAPRYWPLALESFERALTLSPDNERIYAEMAIAHAARGDFDTAMALQRRAIQLEPDSVGLQSELVRMAMRAGIATDADLDRFRRILQAMPRVDEAQAADYLRTGDLDLAVLVIEEMLRRDPKNGGLRRQLTAVTREAAAQRERRARPDGARERALRPPPR